MDQPDYNHEELRQTAQEEIEELANKHISVKRITHFTRDEADDKLGKTWTNLSDIYLEDDTNISNTHDLQDELQEREYIAVIGDQDGACLIVQVTHDLYDRLHHM
jgi:hypothetical protein